MRRFPLAKREILKAELEKMERNGIIAKQTNHTEWLSNILMVRKGSSYRICLDPIPLNKAIKRTGYQFTTIDEILPELTRAKVFSTVDASKGFWQVKLEEDSSKLTTFSTPFGNYRWLRLPFGISSSPKIFQMRLTEITSGLKGTEIIADDIVITGGGDTIEEAMKDHNSNLEALLKRFDQNNFKLNKSKLKLCKQRVKFFGHYLTIDGLEADDTKLAAIREYPAPKDKKALARFLGMVTFLGRYIKNLSEETAMLRNLTHPKAIWVWKAEQEVELTRLKQLVMNINKLKYFNVNKPLVIECDASSEGLGAALFQDDQPFAYASRRLTPAEKNGFAMIEKEMAAIVFACTRFHQMVVGNPQVLVRTDHKPLINIFHRPLIEAPKRLQMMMMILQKYDLKFDYIKSKDNAVADALSRAPVDATEQFTEMQDPAVIYSIEYEKKLVAHIANVKLMNALKVSSQCIEELKSATKMDQTFQKLKQMIAEGWPERYQEVSENLKFTTSTKMNCHIKRGLFFEMEKF